MKTTARIRYWFALSSRTGSLSKVACQAMCQTLKISLVTVVSCMSSRTGSLSKLHIIVKLSSRIPNLNPGPGGRVACGAGRGPPAGAGRGNSRGVGSCFGALFPTRHRKIMASQHSDHRKVAPNTTKISVAHSRACTAWISRTACQAVLTGSLSACWSRHQAAAAGGAVKVELRRPSFFFLIMFDLFRKKLVTLNS